MSTIKELQEEMNGQYDEFETYRSTAHYGFSKDKALSFHEDYILPVQENSISEDTEVITWKLMDQDDYNQSVLANTTLCAEELWDEGTQILCI